MDISHCWLISIGDNVTLAPGVRLIAHDASTNRISGCYTKIGRIVIGNNVFIGNSATILMGTCIGNNVIIGANSTVTHDVPDNMVVAGSPARIICTLEEYLQKEKRRMEKSPRYDEEYTLRRNVSMEKRLEQKKNLKGNIGYID